MNYSRIYNQLIERGKQRVLSGYTENHHIIPRCMGGSDDPENLVALTPEEHFVAHMLLVKIHPSHGNLIFAVQKMCQPVSGRPKRVLYGWLRRRFAAQMSLQQTGSGNSQYGLMWITNGIDNKKINSFECIPLGWQKGRKLASKNLPNSRCARCGVDTGSRRRKLCEPHRIVHRLEIGLKGRENTDMKKVYSGKYFITNGTVDKTISISAIIPEGYWKGRSTNNIKKGN